MSDKGVKINTTEKIKMGGTPGLSDTLEAYERWDMNEIKDPANKNKDSGPKNLGGSK